MGEISYASDTGFWIGCRARLIEDDDTNLKAWAEKHVRKDPDIGWILGNFVEADNANGNGHIFPLKDLAEYSVNTVAGKPLNMLHHQRYIVGAFAGGEMVTPPPMAADMSTSNPTMEALSGMWRQIYREEYDIVARAHKEGTLFYSMEAWPTGGITCPDCTNTYEFKGLQHDSYCAHLNASRVSPKVLNQARFEAGAVIIPPVQPGWSNASVSELSALVQQHEEEAEKLYAGIETEFAHLDAAEWEQMMFAVMLEAAAVEARKFSRPDRKDAAKKGYALPHGGFPIYNAEDLKNAIQSIGRAGDPVEAKAHIKKRAKVLGLTKMVPSGW